MAQRPSITVFQEITSPAAPTPAPQNPTVILGLARQLIWRGDAGTFTGGLTNPAYEFPGLLSTSTLIRDTDTTVPARLTPTVELRTAYGDLDITDSVTFSYLVSPPTFTIPSGLSEELTFQTGTTGAYSRTTGKFTDPTARFVTNNVQAGATIYIGGVASLTVDVVDSETVLSVTQIDKGSDTADGDLTAEVAGVRTFTSPGATFVTDGVVVGDKLRVWGYEILDSVFGASYPATGAGATRTLTDTDADFTAAPAVASIAGGADPTVSTSTFHSVQVLSGSDRIPTFWVDATGAPTATTAEITPYDAAADPASTDTAYTIFSLGTMIDLDTTASTILDVGAWSEAAGTLTWTTATVGGGVSIAPGDVFVDLADGGRPLFVITDVVAGPGVTSASVAPLYSAASGSSSGSGIFRSGFGVTELDISTSLGGDDLRLINVLQQDINFIYDTSGGAGPSVAVTGSEDDGFTVTVTDDGTATVAAVVAAINADTTTGLVAFEIQAGTADTAVTTTAVTASNQIRKINGGGSYTAETGGVRTLNAPDQNFTTSIAPASTTFSGDERPLVKDAAGVSTFYVEAVVDDENLTVRNVTPGAPAAGASSADFGFRIFNAASGLADGVNGAVPLTVKAVISETVVEVANDNPAGDPPVASAFTDLGYRLTTADTLSGQSYTVGRTLSGADLTGTVLVTFSANRTDLSGSMTQVEDDPQSPIYWETVLGPAVSDNPLALAAMGYAANTNAPFLVLGVNSETLADFNSANDTVGVNDAPYGIVPLTQDPEILALYPAHVAALNNERPQKAYINHLTPGGETLAEDEASDIGFMTVTKTVAGTITVDLTARDISGLIELGDVFTGSTAAETFSGSITSITVPIVGTTKLTITPTTALSVVTAEPLTDWTITARTLSLQERAEFYATTANGIANKRVNLLYPPSFTGTFTDTTAGPNAATGEGFYGGGDIDEVLGGHYLCVLEAAKRVEFNPRLPTTKRGSAGLVKSGGLIDPLTNSKSLQDLMIDAGVFYLVEVAPASVASIRSVTTKVDDLAEYIDSAVYQFDNFERLVRRVILPILGPYANDANFLSIVSSNLTSVIQFTTKTQRSLKQVGRPTITVSKDTPDTVDIDIPVVGYADGAKANLTMRIGVAGGE